MKEYSLLFLLDIFNGIKSYNLNYIICSLREMNFWGCHFRLGKRHYKKQLLNTHLL